MLLSRYGDLAYVMDRDWQDGIAIIKKALEKQAEQRAWEMWLMKYQHMDKDSFMPFSEFLRLVTQPSESAQSIEEIIAQAERIKAADQGR